MRFYRCKCGNRTSLGSDSPRACQGCPDCNTTLETHPDDHREPAPHAWKTSWRIDGNTGERSKWRECRVCHHAERDYEEAASAPTAAEHDQRHMLELLGYVRKYIDVLLATPDDEFARMVVAGLIRDQGLGRWLISINNLTAWSCQRETDGLGKCPSWCGRCIASLRDSGGL